VDWYGHGKLDLATRAGESDDSVGVLLARPTPFRGFAGLDRLRRPWRGDAAARYVELGDLLVWATSDSSFNANAHWQARLDDLRALRTRLSADRVRPRGR
jgi:hypothetical protein